jgi:hypothetical protein
MGVVTRFMAATQAAIGMWSDTFFNSEAVHADVQFGAQIARQTRYNYYWAFYQNNAYNDVHRWADVSKANAKLYRHIRHVYNPTFRLIEMYATHLMGGALDADAGDGRSVPSCLPIETTHANLRPAIAKLWKDSDWATKKAVWTRWGACLGDVGLRVLDDPQVNQDGVAIGGKVRLAPVHPGQIARYNTDAHGNCIGYRLEYWVVDPTLNLPLLVDRISTQVVMQAKVTEIAVKQGDHVHYLTLKNDAPYAWNGVSAEWDEPYPFVPMWLAQHSNVGGDWGWAEMHPVIPKFREVDDLASKVHDHIRRKSEGAFLLAGVRGGVVERADDADRDDITMFSISSIDTKVLPLVMDLDIAGALQTINALSEEIEREYPELRFDRLRAAGDVSGAALRTARQPAESKIRSKRTGYDHVLAKAQAGAMTIGGIKGYPGYEGFSMDSWDRGDLDHTIGERPVFDLDEGEKLADDQLFWTNAKAAVDAGVPLRIYLDRNGWSTSEIAAVETAAQADQASQLETIRKMSSANATENPAMQPGGGQ